MLKKKQAMKENRVVLSLVQAMAGNLAVEAYEQRSASIRAQENASRAKLEADLAPLRAELGIPDGVAISYLKDSKNGTFTACWLSPAPTGQPIPPAAIRRAAKRNKR